MVRLSAVLSGFARTMRAIRVHEFGGPEVLKLEQLPIPSCSGSQVLVRVMSAGVNPVETYIRAGTHAKSGKLPYTPGDDAAGIVEDVGPDVTRFKKGERVFCTRQSITGAYAEFSLAEQNCCWHLPTRLTFSQGAAIGIPYFTAYRALIHKCQAKPSQKVLIHGASGAVGIAGVQLARTYRMTVFGTAGTAEGLKIVRENGAHQVFNHKDPTYLTKILEATNNEGVENILEMLSNVNLGKDLTLLSRFGSVCVIGCRGTVEINPRLLMGKESSIVGTSLYTSSDSDWKEMGAALASGLEGGWLTPVIDKEYPLEQAAQAHHDIIESAGAKGKLVLAIASQC